MKDIILDACLPRQIVEALRLFRQESVYHLHERFQEGALDEYFIPHLGREGWVLLTSDYAMGQGLRTRGAPSPQAKVLAAYNAMAIFLPKNFSNLRLIEQGWRIIMYWNRIRATAEIMGPGQIYDIDEKGAATLRT